MDFEKKGRIGTKYLAEGCEFKKDKNSYKLISSQNYKFQPFVGKTFGESTWDLISDSNITSGEKHNELYGLLLNHFKSGQTIFSKDANILLKKGEHVVFQSPNNIILKEPKSVRVTNSAHVGSGRRRGNRSFGYGVSQSVGETQEIIKAIDSGQIIITNKRFIFSGTKRNIDVNISQITGITPYTDAIKLQRKSKQKPEYFINIDGYFFNYTFNGEKYFFIMNGQFVKSLIEGGLNKTPQTSKLQLKSTAQKQIKTKHELIKYSFEDIVLEASDAWKKVENAKKSHFLTLERIDGIYKAKIHMSGSNIPQNQENFENEVKNLVKESGFSLTNFEKKMINGIEMLSVSSFKNINNIPMELYVTYFSNKDYQFGIYLTINQLDKIAKNDYDNIINSIRFKEKNNNEKLEINFCPNCGAHVNQDGKFCSNCGFKLFD